MYLVRRAKSVDSVQYPPDENSEATWRFHCEDYTVSLSASGIQLFINLELHECQKYYLR